MPDSNSTRYGDVDRDPDSSEMVDAMQTAAGDDAVQVYKRRSHDLLDLSAGDHVLDAGCGPGDDVLMLADRVGPDGKAVGVDKSAEMIQAARSSADDTPSAQFEVDDILSLSFDDDTFDATRTDRVLQHVESPAEGLAELRRVTKPSGRVGVTEPDWASIVIDTPTGHTEQFLTLDHAAPRHPTIGRRVYRLAKQAGLVDIDLAPFALPVTDYEVVKKGMHFEDHTAAMMEAGEVTAAEVEEWLEGVQQAGERDAFLYAVTQFTVVGAVPESK